MPHVRLLPIGKLAKDNHIPKSANMILLGMAADSLSEIIPAERLRKAIGNVFARKGEAVVEMNYKAFDLGLTEHEDIQ